MKAFPLLLVVVQAFDTTIEASTSMWWSIDLPTNSLVPINWDRNLVPIWV